MVIMGNLEKQIILIVIGGFVLTIYGLPVAYDDDYDYTEQNITNNLLNDANQTEELFVVREVVYEIGILANASSEEDSNSNEEVDLSFFHQHHNGSVIDLSNIPAPIQTNISSQVIAGIAPLNFGQILTPIANDTGESPFVVFNGNESVPIVIPNAVISVNQNYSTTNLTEEEELLKKLKPLLIKNN